MLSDVHGNAGAIEAVRKAVKKEKPDVVLVAGDLVMNGPEPGAAVDGIRDKIKSILRGVADFLKTNAADRSATVQELAWAVIASAEFRFNH